MQRLIDLEQDVVGRVHDVVDGALADALQPGREPGGTWRHLHAASSRPTPLWHSKSGRFADTSIRICSSPIGTASRNGVPGGASVLSSRIPAWSTPRPSSLAEHSIPFDSTPRILRRSSFSPPGSVA